MPTINVNTIEIKESASTLNHDIDVIRALISDFGKIEVILSRMSSPRLNMYQKLIVEAVFHLHQTNAIITYLSEELDKFSRDIEKASA